VDAALYARITPARAFDMAALRGLGVFWSAKEMTMSRSHLLAESLKRPAGTPSTLKMAWTVIGALFGAPIHRGPSR
jgi:hypothetical protein